MKFIGLKLSAITLLLICSTAYSANSTSLITDQKPGFAFSLQLLYLMPSASNLNYAVFTNPLPLPAPNWQQKIVNPSYSAAFDLALQYNLLNNRENAKFDWLHFDSKDSAAAGSTSNTSVGPAFYYGPAQQFIADTSANSTVKFNVDTTNLIFGHLINLSDNIQMEPFVGLTAAYLREKITDNYFGTDPVYGFYTHTDYFKSTFTGLGPRLGLDGKYFITNNVAVIGNLAGDLLAGFIKYSTDFRAGTAYTGILSHNTTPANTSMANQNLNRIVPEIDAKFAMLFNTIFDSGAELSFEAGYMYTVYFNAINQVLPSTLVPGSWEAGSVAIINQTEQQSNIELRGPFITGSFKF